MTFFFVQMTLNFHPKNSYGSTNRKKRKAVYAQPPVITVSHCHRDDKCINTPIHNIELFNKIPRIPNEQDADPVLLNFETQMFAGLPFDEQIIAINHRYILYCRNKKRILIREVILYRQNYNDVADISH